VNIGSIAELSRANARDRPDVVALIAGDRRCTFAELDERSNRVASALAADGVARGDRVAYLGKNTIEFFELLFGAAKAGAVLVAVNWRLAPAEVAHIIDDSGAGVLVVDTMYRSTVDQVRDRLPAVRRVVALGEGPGSFVEWSSAGSPDDAGHRPGPDDVALQLYTSGTTGLPKGAMITNRNIWTMLPPTARDWGFGPGSVSLVALPNFHVGGVGWALIGLYVGATSVVLPEVAVGDVLRVIPEARVTHVVLVPAVLGAMLAAPGIDDLDVSSIEYIVYGASPISEVTLTEAMRRLRCRFIQSYGLTETCGGVIQLMSDEHDPGGPRAHLLRSAGRPMQFVEMQVVDPQTGTGRPAGEVGEIWLRSARVTAGYWNRPDDTAAAIDADGWFHTGDAGYVDDEGYLYISDRVKDMIISGGENIYPAEVENALMAHPAVGDVAVIGVPSERWGETPKALVVLADGAAAEPDELIAFCRSRLASYKCPTSVELVGDLPRNPTGKLLKEELRRPYWAGHDRHVN